MRKRSIAIQLTVAGMLAIACAPASAAPPPRPAEDPFYATPDGFAQAAPGTVLRSREIDVTALGIPLPLNGWQVVYATRDTHDAPVAAVATIIAPQGEPAADRPLVAYQPAEDSLTRDCASSYEISKGDMPELPQALLPLLQDGAVVVVPDYEGPESQWVAGTMAGHAVLDAIRATERFAPAGLGATTKVGLWGYSGGGHATAWAAELQAAYAPELNVVGGAYGGAPAQLRTTIANLDGSPYAGILLAATVGISRAYPEMGFDALLNEAGKAMKEAIGSMCIEDFAGAYPGARIDDFTTVPNAKDVPSVAAVIARNDLGQRAPAAPLYIYHAATDELNPIAGTDKLVELYCARGAKVQYNRALAGEHIEFAGRGAPDAAAYLSDRFAGKPAPNICPPGVPPPSAAKPSAKSCRIVVRLPHRRGVRVKSVSVRIDGRRVVRRGRDLRTLSLRVAKPGRRTLRLRLQTTRGTRTLKVRRSARCR